MFHHIAPIRPTFKRTRAVLNGRSLDLIPAWNCIMKFTGEYLKSQVFQKPHLENLEDSPCYTGCHCKGTIPLSCQLMVPASWHWPFSKLNLSKALTPIFPCPHRERVLQYNCQRMSDRSNGILKIFLNWWLDSLLNPRSHFSNFSLETMICVSLIIWQLSANLKPPGCNVRFLGCIFVA